MYSTLSCFTYLLEKLTLKQISCQKTLLNDGENFVFNLHILQVIYVFKLLQMIYFYNMQVAIVLYSYVYTWIFHRYESITYINDEGINMGECGVVDKGGYLWSELRDEGPRIDLSG